MRGIKSAKLFFVSVATAFLIGAMAGCSMNDVSDQAINVVQSENENVLAVKNGHPNAYPDKTYGESFEAFFGSPTWKYFKGVKEGPDDDEDGKPDYTENNIDVVEFTGYCTYQNVEVKALIQFTLDKESKTFDATFLSFNDVPQSTIMMAGLITRVFEGDEEKTTQSENTTTEVTSEETTTENATITEETTTEAEYVLPHSSEVLLSESDYYDLSLKDITIAKNEIYARHGRKFKDEMLQAHFNSMSWYNGTIDPDKFDSSVLSDIENKNIQMLSDRADYLKSNGSENDDNSSSSDTKVTGDEIYGQYHCVTEDGSDLYLLFDFSEDPWAESVRLEAFDEDSNYISVGGYGDMDDNGNYVYQIEYYNDTLTVQFTKGGANVSILTDDAALDQFNGYFKKL